MHDGRVRRGIYVSDPQSFWSDAAIAAIAQLIVGVPAGLDWYLHRLGAHGFDLADALGMWIGLLLSVAAYVLVFAPWVLLRYCRKSTAAITRLQEALGARPPAQPGGAATCRDCGAALDVPPGALGVRCMYCRTDNLVQVATRKARAEHEAEKKFHREVVSALAEHDAEREQRRKALPGRLVSAGMKTLFAVMLMTFAGRCTEENGHITAANLHRAPAEEGKLFPGLDGNHLQVVKENQRVSSKSVAYQRDMDVQSYRVSLERGQRLVTHASSPEISLDLYRHDTSWRQFTSENCGWAKDNAAKRSAPYTGWYKLAIHRHATAREVKRAQDYKTPPLRFTWWWNTSPP